MIVSLHVASGAAVGSLLRSRLAAVALGPLLHMAGDVIPHRDIGSRRFEEVSGVAALALVAASKGPFSPAALCGAFAAAPDLEHLLPNESKRFPSHRIPGLHREGGLSATTQLALALLLLGFATRSAPRPRSRRATWGRADRRRRSPR